MAAGPARLAEDSHMNRRRWGTGLVLALAIGGTGSWWTVRRLDAMERATEAREEPRVPGSASTRDL